MATMAFSAAKGVVFGAEDHSGELQLEEPLVQGLIGCPEVPRIQRAEREGQVTVPDHILDKASVGSSSAQPHCRHMQCVSLGIG